MMPEAMAVMGVLMLTITSTTSKGRFQVTGSDSVEAYAKYTIE
jgi:hypothetical protein